MFHFASFGTGPSGGTLMKRSDIALMRKTPAAPTRVKTMRSASPYNAVEGVKLRKMTAAVRVQANTQ